ncbi:Abi-alpha family protein, partial [uncultured Jatrophihabitans sp.]|uniref:Abi-alpha family protein n=1 Tax=uncultured Jatrophihabitans sp. TaxID=1610747 RepID=UPI0035C9D801
ARTEPPPPAQVVAAAGNAVVTAARVGRLLGRSYWRVARQLPGVGVVEAQAQRLVQAAEQEFARLLEVPQHLGAAAANPEELRVMSLVRDAADDAEPLRTAMTELLDRSSEADSERSREYLFGSIVSQLVPDEARVLAALADGRAFAVVDVVQKANGRSGHDQLVLANVSTVGTAAGLSAPGNVGTYLGRLHGFGLIEFTHDPAHVDVQFDALLRDPSVVSARAGIDAGRQGNAKIVRKAVVLSALGRDFWTACAPPHARLTRRSG